MSFVSIFRWTESRKKVLMQRPFRSYPIDGSENGQEPGMWDMEVKVPEFFVETTIRI